jgi:hypothetical protein
MQLDAEKAARERAEKVEASREKERVERRYAAVRAQLCKMLQRAAHSIIAEGRFLRKDAVLNEMSLDTFRRVDERAYDVEIIEALSEDQAEKLLHAVAVNEALLTFLRPLWVTTGASTEQIGEVRLKCAVALRRIAETLVALGKSGKFYENEADKMEKLAQPDHPAT